MDDSSILRRRGLQVRSTLTLPNRRGICFCVCLCESERVCSHGFAVVNGGGGKACGVGSSSQAVVPLEGKDVNCVQVTGLDE